MKTKLIFILLLIFSVLNTEAQVLNYMSSSSVSQGRLSVQIHGRGTGFNLSVQSQLINFYFYNTTDTIYPYYSYGAHDNQLGIDFFNVMCDFNMCNPGLYSIAFKDSVGQLVTFQNAYTVTAATLCNAPVFTSPTDSISTISNVLFSWATVPGANSYIIKFYKDSITSSYQFYTSYITTSDTTFQKTFNLLNNHSYFIYVAAIGSNSLASPWSVLNVTINSTPSLLSISPTDTYQGDASFTPTLSGLNTYFQQASNTITYSLDQGNTSIPAVFPTPYRLIHNDEIINSARFNIPANAPTGLYNVNTYDTIDGALTFYNGVYIHESYQYSGFIFYDLNSNNTFDAGDIPYSNAVITDGFRDHVADTSGNFSIYRPGGNYLVAPSIYNLNCFTTNPPDYNFTLGSTNPLQTGVDFALSIIPGAHDLSVSLNSTRSRIRVGAQNIIYINYSNLGGATEAGVVSMLLPSGLTVDSSSNPNYTINGDTMIWNFTNLGAIQTEQIIVYLDAPVSIPIGTLLRFQTSIDNGIGDIDPTNNEMQLTLSASNSYDPNVKTVNMDVLSSGLTYGVYMTYTIYFQNTGNDTAYDISILDTISTNLDLSTLQVMSSSHAMQTIYYPERAVEFRFDNINLLDSNQIESMSHGFVTYRIKTNANLNFNDAVLNTAYIYFDHNAPIVTNECNTIVSSINETNSEQKNVFVYPNPANGKTKILYPFDGKSKVVLMIFDESGKLVKQINYPSMPKGEQEITLDVSGLPNGTYRIAVSDGKTSKSNNFVIQK